MPTDKLSLDLSEIEKKFGEVLKELAQLSADFAAAETKIAEASKGIRETDQAAEESLGRYRAAISQGDKAAAEKHLGQVSIQRKKSESFKKDFRAAKETLPEISERLLTCRGVFCEFFGQDKRYPAGDILLEFRRKIDEFSLTKLAIFNQMESLAGKFSKLKNHNIPVSN